MVGLTAVEDALAGAFPQYGIRTEVAVLTRPDPDKGEALIAVTNERRLTLPDIRAALRSKGVSNLATPRELRFVRAIPKLGTGKVNHRELERIVAEATAKEAEESAKWLRRPAADLRQDAAATTEASYTACSGHVSRT
jgi:acyl-[acyl-carrier-protein]-phospholipid O-acyltransferase/long-chain-fatty-acid--[acyl-carrier-protein] ligase